MPIPQLNIIIINLTKNNMDDNMPHGYSFLDDDLSAEPKEKEFDHHENENVVLPRTHEEVIQNLAKHPEINRNFLEAEAYKHGVDFDNKNTQIEPDFYNKPGLGEFINY